MPPEPFEIAIPDAVLDDVRARLERTAWPLDVGNGDWRYGVERAYLEELVEYWLHDYDWRAQERQMNALTQFRTTIDGLPIHYIHERGKGPDPMPLILSHGWPWTFWDFQKVIAPLADPGAHGADPADAFDVVVPSLPGFGFSTPLERAGVEWMKTADLWVALMGDVLGYERFAAHGGDWGGLITAQLGHKYADRLIGAHLGVCTPMTLFETGLPTEDQYAEDEKDRFHHTKHRMQSVATSHLVVQSDDPQTLAYGLHDSPVGLSSWILERRRHWSDSNGDVESRFSKDDLITTAMLYWVTESAVSSMRYYWEAQHNLWKPSHDRQPVVQAPTAITLWPQELMLMPTALMESFYNLKRLTPMPSGGHFHPMEEPELLVEDIRAFFRTLR
jgi:pimeloyl-ACP methyl ester carboxylesterase